MKSTFRKAWSLGWRLGLAGILLAWAFHAIFHDQSRLVLSSQGVDLDSLPRLERWKLVWSLGPAELGRTIFAVHPGWLVASIALWGVTIVLGAWRWRVILEAQGLPLGWRRTLEISFIAHFLNSFLLGSTGGDLLKAYYAARVTHHRKTEAVASVAVDRVLGLFAMLAFATVMLVPNASWILAPHHSRTLLFGLTVLAMFLAAATFVWVALRGGVSQWFPRAREWMQRIPKGDTLERGLASFRTVGRSPLVLAKTLVISVVLTFACVVQLLTLVWGYGLEVPWTPMLLVVPAVICISALPITPNGLGVRDNLYLYLLSLPEIGVAPNTAVAISLVAYAGSLVWSALGGVLYVFRRRQPALANAVAPDDHDFE